MNNRNIFHFMYDIYKEIIPLVHEQLDHWKEKANKIPDVELKKQALLSIQEKTFHCEGGAIFALLAKEEYRKEVITFIVAYQTISDYLDNLCDRSTSLDAKDFTKLHRSMYIALSPNHKHEAYYMYHQETNDGGYLSSLVATCQQALEKLPNFERVRPYCLKLEEFYKDLQVHKHVKKEERLDRLMHWFWENEMQFQDLLWNEFSAASGSTLGIFSFVSYCTDKDLTPETIDKIFESYFPYVQGLHIMLDYIIDEAEDELYEDLNFCTYYSSRKELKARTLYLLKQAKVYVNNLPNREVHKFIIAGLVGVYLADRKMNDQKLKKVLLKETGGKAYFFYYNRLIFEQWKRMKKRAT